MELTSHMVAGVLPSLPISICWGDSDAHRQEASVSLPPLQPSRESRRGAKENSGRGEGEVWQTPIPVLSRQAAGVAGSGACGVVFSHTFPISYQKSFVTT